jgi:hypothetical protein
MNNAPQVNNVKPTPSSNVRDNKNIIKPSYSKPSSDPISNIHKKPNSLRDQPQVVPVKIQNYGNNGYNQNVLQKPNILSNNQQIVRSDNSKGNPLIKPPSNYGADRYNAKPNNYNDNNKNPIIKPSNNYSNNNNPVKQNANYHYNYNQQPSSQPSREQPSSNQQGNRFLQAVRPSSGVNKVVKR